MIGAAGVYLSGTALTICNITGVLLILYSVVIVGFLANRERVKFYESAARFAESMANLNNDQWAALGIAFPTLRIRWNGQPIQLIEDSEIMFEDFKKFMLDSDYRQISPERNWSTGKARRTWTIIRDWLLEKKYIYEYSAAGNHSWLWKNNVYQTLKDRYLSAEPLRNLNEIQPDSIKG